jgi:tetratricopeptide (TPR) repeat protein
LLRQRARTALNRGDWGSAVELLSTLLETTESDPDDPDDRQALEDRAYAFARLNRLPAALEDLNRIAHLVKQDKDLVLLLERASLYLTYGDSRGYAALCKTAVDTDEPGTAGKIDATVLRLIALDKDGILSVKSQEKDFKAIVAVVSAASPSGGNAPGSALARIGILYRQGHDQEAAALYSQVRASALWSALSAADRAWMMVFAGMANAHLGHRDLSRALFAQVDSYLSPPPQRQPDWWDHFMISVLRREAGGSAGSGSATVP